MSQAHVDEEIGLRILYWGAAGAGKTASLRGLHKRLTAEHSGELRSVPTRLDPTITYEELSIRLDGPAGRTTGILLVAVPGPPEEAQTRKQLLDRTDAIVLVCDARRDSRDANIEALEELRESLGAYGRNLSQLPVVIQYNKRDLTDAFEIESLHRLLGLPEAAVFETVATEGTGLLQALTAISKRTVRTLKAQREENPQGAEEPLPHVPESGLDPELSTSQPAPPPQARRASKADLMEAAILADGENLEGGELDTLLSQTRSSLDESWPGVVRENESPAGMRLSSDLKIVSVGTARARGERAIRIPIVLGNDSGESVSLALTVLLEPMLEEKE